MKLPPRHHYNSRLARLKFFTKPKGRQWAFVLGTDIYYRYEDNGSRTLRNHELIHVAQYLEHGIAGFLNQYFVKEWNVPYREKTFEQEAYGNQHDFGYIKRVYGYDWEI